MTAGYSGTPLASKLGIKPSSRVVLVAAPEHFETELAPLPERASVTRRLRPALDMVIAFVTARAELERRWDAWTGPLKPAGMLWIAWPKKASRVPTDMGENVVRDVALPRGWVDTKVCAVDGVWSALRLVLRVANRPPL